MFISAMGCACKGFVTRSNADVVTLSFLSVKGTLVQKQAAILRKFSFVPFLAT